MGTIFSHSREGITAFTFRGYPGQKILDSSQVNLDPSTGLGSFRNRIDGKIKEFSGNILTPAEDLLQIMDSNGSRYEASDHQSGIQSSDVR